ncbi:MAG: Uncharacterised protein [Opitutia bacterium UBA7350]|nr:MAG: Uncharacterised protein [Opitutae bacterium UBA7350]
MDLGQHTELLLDNYHRCFGEDLVSRSADEAAVLMRAKFVVLSHGTESDPVFNYGNEAAQALFEMDWNTLTALPSRSSAEAMHQSERAAFLKAVQEQGYSEGYGGVRMSASGKRFRIAGARVWNLLDAQGTTLGQAATFSEWEALDEQGTLDTDD